MPLGAFKAALRGTAGTATTGDVVLLSSQTASDSASITFSYGIDSTYGEYIFKFYNMHPASTDSSGALTFQVNATDGADYNDSAITSTFFWAQANEGDSDASLEYVGNGDQQQGTAYQELFRAIGMENDESCSGELHLFNPAGTSYLKEFYAIANSYANDPQPEQHFTAGFIKTTAAITEIKFQVTSGTFSGTIYLYGMS